MTVPAAPFFPQAADPHADWHRALAEAIRDPDELIQRLALPEEFREPARQAARLFPLLAPHSYIDRMRPGDPHDPLLRQVLPLGIEAEPQAGFLSDPVGDDAARIAPGLLRKYQGRALFISTGACAVHCRYCFRRHYPYGAEPKRLDDWEPAFAAVAADPSLHEIILSGGDPLMLADARLEAIVARIASLPHITRLRIHTRLPIVLPERVTDRLIDGLTVRAAGSAAGASGVRREVRTIVVVHANHPRELTGPCPAALRRLIDAGMTVLNQAVLLRGINDSVEALAGLCERLIDLGILPYYLHQLDRVAGAAHFEVPEAEGLALVAELRRRLPGYAVPQYVRETPGELSKQPIRG
jgi:EF-P beta-lysylation protein EpmB